MVLLCKWFTGILLIFSCMSLIILLLRIKHASGRLAKGFLNMQKSFVTEHLRNKQRKQAKINNCKLICMIKEIISSDKLFDHNKTAFKDGAYYCYCAYVLRISKYSDFQSPMLTNTGIFLHGLKLSGESRS